MNHDDEPRRPSTVALTLTVLGLWALVLLALLYVTGPVA